MKSFFSTSVASLKGKEAITEFTQGAILKADSYSARHRSAGFYYSQQLESSWYFTRDLSRDFKKSLNFFTCAMLLRQIVEQYIDGWKDSNSETILGTLTGDAVIIESHGPVYRGKDKIRLWINDWIAKGNTVDRWDITSFYEVGDTVIFEWLFECTVENKKHALEGVSICKFENGKINYLREYRTTKPTFDWNP